jgi:predicted permease
MLAGAICEETDCTGLVMIFLAILAGFVIIVTIVAGAWAMTISAVLHRRGWKPAPRRVMGALTAGVLVFLLWGVATAVPDLAPGLIGPVTLASVPVAVWQRRVTRRELRAGDRQSSPCSTA